MKKNILLLIIFITLISCSNIKSPEENLIIKVEENLKISMNDPNSYEFVSFEEDIKKEANIESEYKKLNIEPEFRSNLRYYKLKYRGKNAYGALILSEIYVLTNEDYSFIKFEEIEN